MVAEDVRARVLGYIEHQAQKSHDAIASLVEESQQRLLGVLAAVDQATSERRPAPDEWCVRELLLHVVDSEAGVASLVTRLARGEAAALRVDPGRLADRPADYPALVERLREVNVRMLEAIRALPPEPNLEARTLHPFFGELNCREWAVFQRIHDADHLQHAQKILAAVAN